MDARVPEPAAGWGYSPPVLSGQSSHNRAMAHVNGFRAEIQLVNRIVANHPNEVIVQWDKPVTQNGSDVITVNRVTGEVTLWDSKYRSHSRRIPESATFNPGSPAYNNAPQQAADVINMSETLPPNIIEQATRNLDLGIVRINTTGGGQASNSTTTRRP